MFFAKSTASGWDWRRWRAGALATAVVLAAALGWAACGGGDDKDPTDPGDPGDPTIYMRAKVDGVAWESERSVLPTAASHVSPGLYVLIASTTNSYRFSFTLSNIPGPGTYPLGVSALVRGGTVTLSLPPSTWLTPLSGAAGTITLTEVTNTRIKGTFAFSARAVGGGPNDLKSVTDGEFDLPLTTVGVIGPIPDNAWSEVKAQVNGTPFLAANIATLFNSGSFAITAFNENRTLTMTLTQVNGPGTYALAPLPPARLMTVVGDGVNANICCWGVYGAASGSVTITSITSTRVRGTFSATLEPAPSSQATGTVEILSGTFDNGLVTPP